MPHVSYLAYLCDVEAYLASLLFHCPIRIGGLTHHYT